MRRASPPLLPKQFDTAFKLSLILKGIFAANEIILGIGTWFVNQDAVMSIARKLTTAELSEDPNDFVANRLLQFAQEWSVNRQHFLAIYLLGHGIIKIWLIFGRFHGKDRY